MIMALKIQVFTHTQESASNKIRNKNLLKRAFRNVKFITRLELMTRNEIFSLSFCS